MKRSLDVIRSILLAVEGQEVGQSLNLAVMCQRLPDTPSDSVAYHMQLLSEAGYVRGVVATGPGGIPRSVVLDRLEWAGHDFLDSIRSPQVWDRTKSVIEKAGSWTLASVAETARAIATKFALDLLGPGA